MLKDISSIKKDEKAKIKFIPFPDIEKKKKGIRISNKVYYTLALIVLIFLFGLSSYINVIYIYGNTYNDYKYISNHNNDFYKIEDKTKTSLLKKIGFDKVVVSNDIEGEGNYSTIYGYKKRYNSVQDINDSINVVYSKEGLISLEVTLTYDKDSLVIDHLKKDFTSIIGNFYDIKITSSDINKVLNKESFTKKYKDKVITYKLIKSKETKYDKIMISIN